MRMLRLVLLPLVLVGCLKQVEGRVAGSDDDQLAAYEAKLEELRARGAAGEPSCAEQCDVATQTCGVAEHLCAVVERHPDRDGPAFTVCAGPRVLRDGDGALHELPDALS
jgi:hypothetical protein